MPQRFVYFDLGKVLVHFDHQTAVSNLAKLSGRPRPLIEQAVFESDLQNRYETGLVTSPQFVEEVNVALESALPGAEILEAISDIFSPNLPILQAIDMVRSAGLPLGILSNTCEAHWQWISDKRWPMFGDWWQQIVLSYEVQSMKPAARIYEVCEQRAGCQAGDIFFTDDREENIAAAAARGWATYHFTSAETLVERLRTWLR
jgi:FMN phosphatase YigB (HAD superfamily)